jgi:hypothetical protein
MKYALTRERNRAKAYTQTKEITRHILSFRPYKNSTNVIRPTIML